MRITPTRNAARSKRAFSLVELMTVVLIIAVLVALVVGIAGPAEQKAAYEKCRTQLALIKQTLAAYKEEWGEFPRSPDGNYEGDNGARMLYQVMTGDGDDLLGGDRPSNGQLDREEFDVKPKPPLDPNKDPLGFTRKNPSGESEPVLLDPFGNPWNYRPFDPESEESDNKNQTYDLWSYGSDAAKTKEPKWIKNW